MPRRRRRTAAAVALAAAGIALLAACRADGAPATTTATATTTTATRATPAATPTRTPAVTPLPANARFDYQLGGAYPPPAGTGVVVRDRTAAPAPGAYSICYVNAFQTQPGEAGFWTIRHPDLLLRDGAGRPVVDPDWPDEYVLDTSTAAKRAAIAAIEYPWIDGCATRGYQAVEPDNLDTWTRWPDRLTRSGNLALAKLLAARAHGRGLAIGQKNAAELGGLGRTGVGFDFAVVEQCQVYAECDAYTKAYGTAVLEIEYTDQARSYYAAACKARGRSISVIYRDVDLVAKGRTGYHYEGC